MTASVSPMLRMSEFVSQVKSGDSEALFVCCSYSGFIGLAMLMWHAFSDQDLSAILVFAGLIQTAAFYMLLHKVKTARSAAGISSKTLQTFALALCCRLTSTLFKNGYLPIDRSADWFYQATDIASLVFLFQILFLCHKRYADTYQESRDSFPIYTLMPACLLIGMTLNGDMCGSPFFDKAWMTAMWLDAVAMLPQLWMVTKGGKADALTAHFVALMYFCHAVTFHFWYDSYNEFAPKKNKEFTGEFNKLGYVILASSVVQIVISTDFMYYYCKWQSANLSAVFCTGARKATDGVVVPTPTQEYDV